jgi:hypothetical protein
MKRLGWKTGALGGALLLGCGAGPAPEVDSILGAGSSSPEASARPEGPASIVDAPGLILQPIELKLVMRAPREPVDGLLRVTAFRSIDPDSGVAPTGEVAQLNRVVELPPGETETMVTLQLASHLYYQASFGAGELPQKGDWMGPMTQWLGSEHFYLLVNQMKIE